MKDMRKRLILISFVLAAMAAIAVFAYLHSLRTPRLDIKKVTILVAAETIQPRTLIEKKMIKKIEVEESSILSNYIKDSSKIIGKYTKEAILKNEGFQEENLLSKNENNNELSLNIDANHRAISINATGDSGVSDLIKPGDYVDVIVYLSEKKDGQKVIRPDMAKVILQNIEVLGIDNTINRDGSSKENESEKVPTNFYVTLSVPTSEIEKLVLAEDIGSLKLALRPLKKEKSISPKGATENELIKDASNKVNNAKSAKTSSLSNEDVKRNKKNKYRYYKIRKGDTLKNISRIYYGNSDNYILIKKSNKIQDENHIEVGKTIRIPVNSEMR